MRPPAKERVGVRQFYIVLQGRHDFRIMPSLFYPFIQWVNAYKPKAEQHGKRLHLRLCADMVFPLFWIKPEGMDISLWKAAGKFLRIFI